MITALLLAALFQAAAGDPAPASSTDATPAASDSTPTQSQTQAPAAAPQSPTQPTERRICHMEATIGSIITHRVCRTVSTQENDRQEAERVMNYLQSDRAPYCASGPGSC